MTSALFAPLPLSGLLVLDLGQMYNGSYCGMLMARHGARVIKVESPSGEALRLRAGTAGARLPFYLINTNKESLALDLKHEKGRELFLDLVRQADVVIENYAPATMERFNLGWEVMRSVNPRLIYASSSGYGRGGPYENFPGMDLTVQAMTGTMATTGTQETGPLKTGPASADFLTGVHLLSAILMALLQRTATGRGQRVEVAMADAVLPSLTSSIAYQLGLGQEPPRTGNRHSGLAYAPYNVYEAMDGHIAIFCVRDEHWRMLAACIGLPELADDSRFATISARVGHMDELDVIVAAWTTVRDKADAFELLMRAGVPAAPVLNISEVLVDPHFRERNVLIPMDHPVVGPILVFASPLRFSDSDAVGPLPAPGLGDETTAILSDLLGLAPDNIEQLFRDGVVGSIES